MVRFFFSEDILIKGAVLKEGDGIWLFILMILGTAICAYILGSLNSAIIITRLVYREDIRSKGSGNAGMTNVMRNYGWIPAVFTLLGDMLKVFLAMVIGTLLFGYNGAYIAGLFCVLGHIAPAIYRFKGGKGVAPTAMFVLYVNWQAFLILLLMFVLIVWATKYLSLGSVMGMLIMPLVMFRSEWNYYDRLLRLIITFIIAGLVVYMHRTNIKRIMNKTENKFHFKRTVKKSGEPESAEAGIPGDSGINEDETGTEVEEDSEEVRKRKEMNRRKSKKKKK